VRVHRVDPPACRTAHLSSGNALSLAFRSGLASDASLAFLDELRGRRQRINGFVFDAKVFNEAAPLSYLLQVEICPT